MKAKIEKAENGWVVSTQFSQEDDATINVIENKNEDVDDIDIFCLVKELPYLLGAMGGKRGMNIRTIFIPGHDYSSQVSNEVLRELVDMFSDIGHALLAHEEAGGTIIAADSWVDIEKVKLMLAALKTGENDGTIQ